MMIDQSKDLGIWKDNSDQAQSSTDKLADAIQKLVDWLDRIPSNVSSNVTVTTKFQSDGTAPDLPGSPSRDGVHTNYPHPGKYGYNDDGTPDWDGDPSNSLAAGGLIRDYRFRSTGTDVVPAMLTVGEGIISKSAMDRIGVTGLSNLNSGMQPYSNSLATPTTRSTSIGTIAINVYAAPGSDITDPYQFGQNLAQWSRSDTALIRTTIERIADSRIAIAGGKV